MRDLHHSSDSGRLSSDGCLPLYEFLVEASLRGPHSICAALLSEFDEGIAFAHSLPASEPTCIPTCTLDGGSEMTSVNLTWEAMPPHSRPFAGARALDQVEIFTDGRLPNGAVTLTVDGGPGAHTSEYQLDHALVTSDNAPRPASTNEVSP